MFAAREGYVRHLVEQLEAAADLAGNGLGQQLAGQVRGIDSVPGVGLGVVDVGVFLQPADLRQAVVLREIEGLSYEEIAAAMNCPVGTVRSRIFRAREAISTRVRPPLDKQAGKRW